MNWNGVIVKRWLHVNELEFDSYVVSVERLKTLINKLPDDGKIKIEVEKHYNDGRIRHSLEEMNNLALLGKVLIIRCSTVVS